MSLESEPLEAYYASNTLRGLIYSGLILLKARRVRPRSESKRRRTHPSDIFNHVLYALFIIVPAFVLNLIQHLRTLLTGKTRRHEFGAWQWYLQTGLREDTGRFTNETTGFHSSQPDKATDLDNLTAWIMTVVQFLWNYDDLMEAVWNEWTMLRIVSEAAELTGLSGEEPFYRLQRAWEVERPYRAPLNGTYADIRRAYFDDFITPCLEKLPETVRQTVLEKHQRLSRDGLAHFRKQMSLLARMAPGRFADTKHVIPLWNACIGLIVKGRYYLLDVADHDESGLPVVYGYSGKQWRLQVREGQPVSPIGDNLTIEGDQVYRAEDGELVGYLATAPVSRIKWQIRAILANPEGAYYPDAQPIDVFLAETPRRFQHTLRQLLPQQTRRELDELNRAPIIINWVEQPREATLAELRRTQRGIGDHALTIMRTESSIIFDQSHAFFDGTWSMAMAEVLTNSAINWRERCMSIAPSEAPAAGTLRLAPSQAFVKEALAVRQLPEISAETIIWDISNVFSLRRLLMETGTRLTVNDLLVITRIFHAAHYVPSPSAQQQIKDFQDSASIRAEEHAIQAVARSLLRGRVLNPALLIPVDASPTDPQERLFPVTFRNLADNLVWIWDDTWDTYQAYRRIEPPNTPEGIEAFHAFALARTLLVGNLRAFSYILDANKVVAIRGDSINVAIMNLLVGLPSWLQTLLKEIPEMFPMLNEIIRGDEVYSNVGRVAEGSTLSRFMTAKDDGNTKALAWGFMTDDQGRLIVTMRDFRPHVKPLIEAGRSDLAQMLAQDYVVAYTADLIGLVARLSAMLQAKPPQPL
jgi:hypothetical protein